MTEVLEELFSGYFEKRLDGALADPDNVKEAHRKIMEKLDEVKAADNQKDDILDEVSIYGLESEKYGFFEGFRRAWEMLDEMRKGR